MSFLDEIGLQRTIDWVKGELSGKVDREHDKGLSTNDYSDVDKAKLNGVEAEATKNSAGTNISISSTGRISAVDTIYDDSGIKADINTKQDKLIAGDNIDITDDTISATDTIYDDSGVKADIGTKQDKLIAGDNIDITGDTISATDTIYNDTQIKADVAKKQDKLVAGDNITIDPVTNTISGTAQYDDSGIKADIDTKQDKLIAGANVQIDDATNTISAVDTIYDDTQIKADIETKQDKLTAGDNITIDPVTNTISGTAQYDDTAISKRITTLENKEDKDTITTINGKTGAIGKSDITALGIPSQDTVYKKPSSEPISYIQGLQAELDSKVESHGTNSVMQIAVINAGGSTTGIPSNTLILELE